jgi:hypothetical protein
MILNRLEFGYQNFRIVNEELYSFFLFRTTLKMRAASSLEKILVLYTNNPPPPPLIQNY